MHLVAEAPPDRMLTLTAATAEFESPEDAARVMAAALGPLMTRLRRWASPTPIEYLAVWERTKAGWPHLHVLVRGPYIPHALLSRLWAELARSPNVWLTALSGTTAGARYVSKYLTKDPDPFGRGRALRVSRGFLVEPMRPQGSRSCTLGPVKVYRGVLWDWLIEQLAELRLVELQEGNMAVSVPWSAVGGHESSLWLRWEGQRTAVAQGRAPPRPPAALAVGPFWSDAPSPPASRPTTDPARPPRPRLGFQTTLTGWRQ